MENKYDVIIGLEIHAELKTRTKMFCTCDNNATDKEANTTVCPICLAHPGTLPVPNLQAIEWTILLGLALHCQINKLSKFDRKNYFYPDLPKGYQISQFDLPIAYGGYLEVANEKIMITRIHLEEDTGKLLHPAGKNYSLVDYNRAGTPLIEMVTEPVIRDATTAKNFCQGYQQILRYLGISEADMEKGEMRCEANVSIQEKNRWEYLDGQIKPKENYRLNPKIELKNINSFKAMERAIDYEIRRQEQALADGEKLLQETRGWNDDKSITFSQRIKETSADYRYFPEPDIPPLAINDEWIEKIKANLVELPTDKAKRFRDEYLFSQNEAKILAQDKPLADFTEQTISELCSWIIANGDDWERQKNKLAKITANWLINELFKHLKAEGQDVKNLKITPENFAELVCLIYQGKINSSAGQTILAEMFKQGGDPTDIMSDLGLEQIDDLTQLEVIIEGIVEQNPKQAEQFRQGKENILQYFVGQAMAATKGKANPKLVLELLKKILFLKN